MHDAIEILYRRAVLHFFNISRSADSIDVRIAIIKPESTERMRGGWIRKGREAWVMVQCPDAAGFERVRVETAMPGGC